MGQAGGVYDLTKKIHINVARLKKEGENFEVDVDPDLAIKFKQGDESISIREILKAPKVFNDAKKGMLASENRMQTIFNTSDAYEVAKIIIKQGEIQLTSEYRSKLVEEKRKKIINIIHRNGIDPKTKLPHPVERIENAFKEAKVHINESKKAEDQVKDVLAKLRPILPIKFEVREIEVHIPGEFAGKSYAIIKSFSKILKDNWNNDGSLTARVEIPAGLTEDFFDKLNNLTHGKVESKILSTR
tara:strand:+ start:11449 stop:12180 length:732 start_codon:yes stop_codon:yes gene_type:complete